jgi:hypothetical protein
MIRYWFAGAAALVLSSGLAAAQSAPFDASNSTQPNMSTNGPAGTYSSQKVQQSVDGNGQISKTTQSFSKSQTYSSGNGALTAHTIIHTSGPTTTTTPTPVTQTDPQETTK